MRFEQAVIPLAPRQVSHCLDLAFVFLRQHVRPLAALWGTVAIPTCGLVYFLVDRYEYTIQTALIAWYVASSPLGVLLIAGSAPSAFGEPFTWRGTMARLRATGWSLVLLAWVWRLLILISAPFLLFPGWYLAVRKGFLVEQKVLSRLAGHLHDRRTNELLKGEIGDLCLRSFWIMAFSVLLWVSLMVTIDFASTYLLGLPILWGRMQIDLTYLDGVFKAMGYVVDFLWNDPAVVTLALAAGLMAYVPARLAWFFCYIDVRVRRDCWDMELEIVREAERLEAT
ncbi:MAG: hypothetical protein ACKV0T_21990 [Planctomycetales bacterium]